MAHHLLSQRLLLGLIPVLEEFLDNVVAKYIHHELDGIGLDLLENLFFLIAVCGFQLLLDEARAVLIAAKLDNMIVDVLQNGQLSRTFK